jgi:hypothetical protein
MSKPNLISLRVPPVLKKAIERRAAGKAMSVNTFIMRCLEDYTSLSPEEAQAAKKRYLTQKESKDA